MRELLGEWLTAQGYRVIGRPDGSGLRAPGVDLVVVDVPNLRTQGAERVSEVQANYPLARLIGMSTRLARSLLGQSAAASALGVRRLIAKPCTRDELLQAVADALGEPR